MTLSFTKLFAAAILIVALTAASAAQKTSFPGAKSKARSPDGRYVIRNDDDSLSLIDSESGKQTRFYDYRRHVDVLWSPRSNAFVINDHEGSDSTKPLLFPLPWRDARIDLWEKLIPFLKSHGEAHFALENHHVYFTVEKWLNGQQMLCKLSGYGEVDDLFTRYYVYDVRSGFRHVRRRSSRK